MPIVPNTFNAGSVAQASQVNDNFQVLAAAILPTFVFTVPGSLFVGSNLTAALISNRDWTILKVYAYAKTAPVGANILIDIKVNGVSIWSVNPANMLAITAGSQTGSQTIFDTNSFNEEDIVTLDITGVGSSTPGADLTVEIKLN